jgi:hypothetical protein
METVPLPHSGLTQVPGVWSVPPQAFLQQAAQDTPAAQGDGREGGGQEEREGSWEPEEGELTDQGPVLYIDPTCLETSL